MILCKANHALVAVGHFYDHNVQAAVAIQRIPAFIVNNDAEGPYCKFVVFPQASNEASFLEVEEIIVIVPREVTLRGEEAERMAVEHAGEFLDRTAKKGVTFYQVLASLRPDLRSLLQHLEFRTYLRPSIEWQEDLRKYLGKSGPRTKVACRLIELDYPKYIWITEISSSDLLNKVKKQERQCLGCVVVDSTAPARTRGAIAMHLADALVLNDRQTGKTEVRHIPDSTPFSHKVW